MISLSKKSISSAFSIHEKEILNVLETKKKVLSLCLKYYGLQNKIAKQNFTTQLEAITGSKKVITKTVNFFLLSDKQKTKTTPYLQRQIQTTTKPDLFFITKYRKFANSQEIIQALESEINFLDHAFLLKVISGNPSDILSLSNNFNDKLSTYKAQKVLTQVKRLLSFLFDYDDFSKKNSIYTPSWGAYELTNKLDVRACLYCNRNYVITVISNNKIIRPELDHFFPKSKHPILALSFYNLIPSCHTCNSNLKGKVDFDLDDYFHPYISNFDKEGVKFTYKPLNPKAFFGDSRNIVIKLNRLNILRLHDQIEGNIKIFKLDEIYNEHVDIVAGLQLLYLKTNKKKIKDIFENVLVDSRGKKHSMSEKEIYELAIRNHFSSEDFAKKPMSKFEKDIAEEIGLIKKS
jgi:hypothetical protein